MCSFVLQKEYASDHHSLCCKEVSRRASATKLSLHRTDLGLLDSTWISLQAAVVAYSPGMQSAVRQQSLVLGCIVSVLVVCRQAARVRTKMLSMVVQAKKVQLSAGDDEQDDGEAETETQVSSLSQASPATLTYTLGLDVWALVAAMSLCVIIAHRQFGAFAAS